MGFWTIPNTLAAMFIPIMIYLLLKARQEKARIRSSLTLVFMGAIILTHALTSVFMAILFFAFWVGIEFYNSMRHQDTTPTTFRLFILFTVGMLSWWAGAPPSFVSTNHINILAELIRSRFSSYFLFGTSVRSMPTVMAQYAYNLPLSEQLFNNLGIFLFAVISIVGCLYIVSNRIRTSYRFFLPG